MPGRPLTLWWGDRGEGGLPARLRLDLRAMRFGSHELVGHIVAAVRAAQQDRPARAADDLALFGGSAEVIAGLGGTGQGQALMAATNAEAEAAAMGEVSADHGHRA
ncbi:hypothetical protein ABGB14_14740 [Nonomuraea sp. B10E15]|uniref:hypothetical protein n=1 Tax=Nonomuraea sp. B10E15 TaxID=3153560 RepID=UPI00325C686A